MGIYRTLGPSASATITCLLKRCRPSTVGRFVIAIVVDAINGMNFRWLWPHIGQKSTEVVLPSFANMNAASTIVLKLRMASIETSRFDVSPRAVSCRVATSMTMLESSRRRGFTRETAATSGVPFQEVHADHNGHVAAIAATSPCPVVTMKACWRNHRESFKALARQIVTCVHSVIVCNTTSSAQQGVA